MFSLCGENNALRFLHCCSFPFVVSPVPKSSASCSYLLRIAHTQKKQPASTLESFGGSTNSRAACPRIPAVNCLVMQKMRKEKEVDNIALLFFFFCCFFLVKASISHHPALHVYFTFTPPSDDKQTQAAVSKHTEPENLSLDSNVFISGLFTIINCGVAPAVGFICLAVAAAAPDC